MAFSGPQIYKEVAYIPHDVVPKCFLTLENEHFAE